MRIGLINFSDEEAKRIQNASGRTNIQVVIEQMKGTSLENQTGCDALIINECGSRTEPALLRLPWSIPAVFVSSRSSLASLSKLPSRAHDFVVAPWEAEEVL